MPSDLPIDTSSGLLVVDDDPNVREILTEYLEFRGFNVYQAADGTEALRRMAETPGLRVLISDVRMPGLSGLELAELARERFPGVRVILISGYFQAQAAGPKFLKKPFTMQRLEAMVRAELTAPGVS